MLRRAALAAIALGLVPGTLIVASSGDAGPLPSWQAAQHSLIERSEVGAARIGDRIYVVGGFRAPNADTTGVLESYDISTDTWNQLRPLPIGLNHAAVTAAAAECMKTGVFVGPSSGIRWPVAKK